MMHVIHTRDKEETGQKGSCTDQWGISAVRIIFILLLFLYAQLQPARLLCPWDFPGKNTFPLQYSCLGNPMDRGAWWATVWGVAKIRRRLNDLACMNTCHFLLQGIFPTQESNSSLLYWQVVFTPLSHLGSHSFPTGRDKMKLRFWDVKTRSVQDKPQGNWSIKPVCKPLRESGVTVTSRMGCILNGLIFTVFLHPFYHLEPHQLSPFFW